MLSTQTPTLPPCDPRLADIKQAGKLRLALFLPQYEKDAVSGELRGLGTGFVGLQVVRTLAARIGVEVAVVELPTPAEAVGSLNTGTADMAFLGIEPSRQAEVDFSPPIFQFDYTLMVPGGSAIQCFADADRPGIRIVVVSGHASSLKLGRMVRRAEVIGVELPDDAFALFRDGGADAFAFPRENLLEFSAKLPSARVLAESYGINNVGIAVAKGHAGRLAAIGEFVEEAKASGLVQNAIERGGLRAFQVPPTDKSEN
jgi:polar amino acid transport system substrate-binding protein